MGLIVPVSRVRRRVCEFSWIGFGAEQGNGRAWGIMRVARKAMTVDGQRGTVEIIEHTADWALRIRGRDLTELFRLAAEGMATLMVGDLAAVPLEQARDVELEAEDAEGLLVAWLGELAYFAERDSLICRGFDISHLSTTTLRAVIRGGRAADIQKHIKAVTYHDLAIVPVEEGLQVTVVFDV